jgi:hypothetical protein
MVMLCPGFTSAIRRTPETPKPARAGIGDKRKMQEQNIQTEISLISIDDHPNIIKDSPMM